MCVKTRASIPDGLDPAVHALLTKIFDEGITWCTVGETVRSWLYNVPDREAGPKIGVVRRELRMVGLDLAVVPYVNDAG